jgi:hypothetical protein
MMEPDDPKTGDDHIRERLRARGAAEYIVREGAAGLLSRWRAFVDAVESGYRFGLDDYRNDLDIRSLIGAVGLADKVAAEDARLRRLLTDTGKTIWSSDAPDAFWVHGYPRNASGELLGDLRAAGIAP